MKRVTLVVALIALFHVAGYSSAQQTVERKGMVSAVKLGGDNFGHLNDLNGKYKLVATQTTFEPGGYVGEHNHVGPGIRYVASGEITLVEQGMARVYKAGDYFYERGDLTNSASNKGTAPAVLITFEILPSDWKGGSAVPPKSK
jgi:quercetin dioxygenase-like cupin family protein